MNALRNLVALLSVALAGGVLGVTLGLWERSSDTLRALRETVGQHTYLVEPDLDPERPSMPLDPLPGDLSALATLPGVVGVALSTNVSRLVTQEVSYPLIGVDAAFFGVRRFAFAAGRPFEAPTEAVVGANLREMLGETVEAGGFPYRVVGVLESVRARGWVDAELDGAIFVPLEAYFGPEGGPSFLFLETTPEAFGSAGAALRAWLEREGIEGYRVLPLTEQYGAELRETVGRLLGGALGFGVAAVLLSAGANLLAFYLARALSRVRQLGVRRAVGATRQDVTLGELWGALPWGVAGLVLAPPLAYLGAALLTRATGVSAAPGLRSLLLLAPPLLLLVAVAAFFPALWAARQPPAQVMRGGASSAPQRRLLLAGAGLALGVAGLVVQATTARAAEAETRRILGGVGERIGTYASVLTEGLGDPRGFTSLTRRDYEALLASPAAEGFSRTAYKRAFTLSTLEGPAGSYLSTWQAAEEPFAEMIGAELLAGRWPAPDAAEVALGQLIAAETFGEADPLGAEVHAFGRAWTVVGVFRSGTQNIPGGLRDEQVLFPGPMVRAQGFGSILVEVAPGRDVAAALQTGADVLNARYGDDRIPFTVMRAEDFYPEVRGALLSLAAVYRALAAALLLLGGGGLAAQMLVALSLRVREIGVRRAVGARTTDIFAQFLGEALRLAALSSAAGLLLGVGLGYLAARLQGVPFLIDLPALALAVALAFFVAALFGAGPALAAARLLPADAVREREA
ncbi:ABC transporter permease [Truepera radiovictrix]|uniref:ABC3 transporter permease protein domain-containing protein n=1 Tax=Truepera radiovictrix (strain DSM 17093 / CIP 108686 / LMG 22925 / RQ-24) TaxID=649638 RepID=D7CVH0_TRURR|nr:ABC transporter permease [Truepera radiovictrix]ADI14198.1 protein of unknown function DUF214 [Truepera radiovictrix DSM 17093]WMT57244.1 ABC transporter permease [Truepera radiovictrix]